VGGKTVIYRFFEVSAKYRAAISSRSTTCNLVCDCEDRKTMGEQREREREREMIAWEAIGILYRSGKRGRDAAGWLAGLVRVKFCERVRANCEKSGIPVSRGSLKALLIVPSVAPLVIFSHVENLVDSRNQGTSPRRRRMDLAA